MPRGRNGVRRGQEQRYEGAGPHFRPHWALYLCVCVCVRSPVFVCVKYEAPHRFPVPHLKTSFLYPSRSLILSPISLIPKLFHGQSHRGRVVTEHFSLLSPFFSLSFHLFKLSGEMGFGGMEISARWKEEGGGENERWRTREGNVRLLL